MVGLWDGEADWERFRNAKLVPALAGTGSEVPALEIWPIETVHTLRTV